MIHTGAGAARAILIAGPTASGKSALALALADDTGGIVVNADAMQVYRDLRIITARPTPADEARAPHRLYGHVDAAVNYSVGHYVRDAGAALADAHQLGRVPIFVGGTGLYFKALTQGLSAVPPTPAATRDAVRAKLAAHGPEALHAELARRDPESAARLSPRDRVRIARALEVFEATGRPLAQWHREGMHPLLAGERVVKLFLAPDRAALYARIDARFARMLGEGALDEVRALAARRLDPLLPAMKAHGVPWLIRYLCGEISLAVASEKAKQDTRHYAKRQFTWFRHQLAEWPQVAPETALEWLRSASSIGRMPAPSTADAAKPAQAAQACLRWAVPLPRCAGEDE
ncbi:MAG: tRNA (adenosine(37)-N6)-dimethylallyltransferase MiaA [Rhodoplanes sp.]